MPSFQKRVILFTRYPQVGKCKTRLIPKLGAQGALQIHRQLVAHVLKVLEHFLASSKSTSLYIYYYSGVQREMRQWLGNGYTFKQQQGNNLGERMADALIHGLINNYNCTLIGSDCPGIGTSLLNESLEALRHNNVVLGPSHDGGYYLIGVAANTPLETCRQLFADIPWGTRQVFSKTLKHAHTLGLNTYILKRLHDIDTAEDLKHFNYCPKPERSL